MRMKTLTVFTPTFNRAGLLPRLYASLVGQTCDDFEWLVVDDGSTDGTAALVKSWQREGRLTVRLLQKSNGGMHTAHNAAYATIETELCVCIDSDDAMPARPPAVDSRRRLRIVPADVVTRSRSSRHNRAISVSTSAKPGRPHCDAGGKYVPP